MTSSFLYLRSANLSHIENIASGNGYRIHQPTRAHIFGETIVQNSILTVSNRDETEKGQTLSSFIDHVCVSNCDSIFLRDSELMYSKVKIRGGEEITH